MAQDRCVNDSESDSIFPTDTDPDVLIENERIKTRAYECLLESIVLIDLLFLRTTADTDVPTVGPNGSLLKLQEKGRKVVLSRRSSDCGCAVHGSDNDMLTVRDILECTNARMLVDAEDIAAWRCAELLHAGDQAAQIRLLEDRAPHYMPSEGRRHYQVVVVRGDGTKEIFG